MQHVQIKIKNACKKITSLKDDVECLLEDHLEIATKENAQKSTIELIKPVEVCDEETG